MTHQLRQRARTLSRVALFGLIVGGASSARAQSLRPNIMFLFDTSGSMHEDSSLVDRADGTTVCPQSTTSRIYSLKSGIRAALQQVGTDEANFGLMSFPQTVQNAYTTLTAGQCTNTGQSPIGHYLTTGTQTITVPNRASTGSHNATTYPTGCLMTTNNSAAQTTYGTWFTTGASQVFEVGVTSAAPGTMPTAAQFDPPGAAQMASIYKWIDNVEAPTSAGAVTDPELHPKANTPLGRSLFYANLYFQNEVIPNDPKGTCRHNVVVMVTDGDDTCDEATAPDNTFNPTDCTGGGNFDYYHPVNQACLLNKAGVKVYVITDITADNANDAIASAGGTGASIRVSLNDANAAKSAIVGIIAQNVPPSEICNGKDDNCNGLIDEGVSNACISCTAGNTNPDCGGFSYNPNDPNDAENKLGAAAHHCAVESCNCKDDNCNGKVDEGLPTNACGGPCGCAVPPDICNGLDDNCDGAIDNGNYPTGPVGTKCNNGLKGACNRDGLLICSASGTDTVCSAPVITPQSEVCNGIDDNCDGQVDEGTLPGVGEKCGNGLGACQAGTIVCKAGKLVCNVTSMPQPEVCNGIDDDCDGIVDDGNFPQTGTPCLCPGLSQSQVGVGICQAGKLKCMGALGFVCTGCVLPTGGEVCNGKDNNCDGKVDTTGNCPGGYGCKDGQCTLQCGGGEFPCPLGYKCLNNYCIPQRCANVPPCPDGQHCDESTGSCVDNCSGVSCRSPAVCMNGVCVDCDQLGCAADRKCVAGVCIVDKCKNVTCGANQYCQDGACQDLCLPGKCSDTQTCVAGECKDSPCANMFCGNGTYCDPKAAACLPDRCLAIQCGAGQRCVSAKATQAATDPAVNPCETDPCATMQCPGDCWTCGITTDGTGTCLFRQDVCEKVTTKVGQKGGGSSGCGCEVGGGPGRAGWLALAVGLMLVAARRRRPR
ncbi:MAG TPA: MopE-related protein [Polyangia bacterium]|nr:MopE-related protein [Polyangia bacterium]